MPTEHQTTIRKAETGDANLLARLASAGFPGYPFLGIYQPEYISKKIDEGELRWVMESKMGILATAVLGGDGVMKEICKVVVDPEFRGNGIGKKITQVLYDEAVAHNWFPWANARAVQPSMQKSALSAGLNPVSIEQGKHVVYYHEDNNRQPTGPARESMVHFTSLNINQPELLEILHFWPSELKTILLKNLVAPLTIFQPDRVLANKLLPSAQEIKNRIHSAMEITGLTSAETAGSDTEIINLSGNQTLIIKPDASAFILNLNNPRQIDLATLTGLGIQIVTTYCEINNIKNIILLLSSGLEPSMLRPWKKSVSENPVWQVGCRIYLNQGEKIIEPANLDPQIRYQLEQIIHFLS